MDKFIGLFISIISIAMIFLIESIIFKLLIAILLTVITIIFVICIDISLYSMIRKSRNIISSLITFHIISIISVIFGFHWYFHQYQHLTIYVALLSSILYVLYLSTKFNWRDNNTLKEYGNNLSTWFYNSIEEIMVIITNIVLSIFILTYSEPISINEFFGSNINIIKLSCAMIIWIINILYLIHKIKLRKFKFISRNKSIFNILFVSFLTPLIISFVSSSIYQLFASEAIGGWEFIAISAPFITMMSAFYFFLSYSTLLLMAVGITSILLMFFSIRRPIDIISFLVIYTSSVLIWNHIIFKELDIFNDEKIISSFIDYSFSEEIPSRCDNIKSRLSLIHTQKILFIDQNTVLIATRNTSDTNKLYTFKTIDCTYRKNR
ncbi:hypothetical protein [Lonepinella sp. BR2357]|uniref:hypothetical protein n=1 Tax=Lonepinella sp. BR2357 TaxID=3434549 RepID=UPI003F6E383C